MSPPDDGSPDAPVIPIGAAGGAPARRGTLVAVSIGLVVGAVLVGVALRESSFADLGDARIDLRVNGLGPRMGRDVLLPTRRWVLQVEIPENLPEAIRETLSVTLREERTGAKIDIADRLEFRGAVASFVMPESLGLQEGLISIRARLVDPQDRELVAHRRVRIRRWLGGPPIGSRQIVHFDFGVDRDGDGRPDFERDLERFGLASTDAPELAAAVARRVAARALARVERAYDPHDDPNGTGLERDPVLVRFALETERSPYVTRICVGGVNADHPESVGHVRFDHRNSLKGSTECEGPPSAGLFPAELAIYRESPLYQEVLAPFLSEAGGRAFGAETGDPGRLGDVAPDDARGRALARAIEVLGDVLGTVMAHESAHALGLVPAGRPGIGLFGGNAAAGDGYAHNLDVDGRPPAEPWLMNLGRGFDFETLAGRGPAGELRFRPLNHAYLRDRVVLLDGPRS